jgi:hypothetical protein
MQLNVQMLKRTDTCLIVCSSDLLPGEAPSAIPGICQQPDRSWRHLIPLDLELLSVGSNEPLVLLSFLAGCHWFSSLSWQAATGSPLFPGRLLVLLACWCYVIQDKEQQRKGRKRIGASAAVGQLVW